jgi:hypothetical protein
VTHRRGPWKTKQPVELATLQWVAWFNHNRLMALLGYIPPRRVRAATAIVNALVRPRPNDLNHRASAISGAVQFALPSHPGKEQ